MVLALGSDLGLELFILSVYECFEAYERAEYSGISITNFLLAGCCTAPRILLLLKVGGSGLVVNF